jgi:multiple sugar transport system permease protein
MAVTSQEVPRTAASPRARFTRKQVYGFTRAALTHLALIPAAIVFLVPFLWMLSTSLKSDAQIYVYPPVWIPNPIQWSNYPNAVTYISFFLYMRNTIIIAVGATIGALLSCSLVAYSLARIPWPGRNILFILTVATLMLPFQVTLIPLFLVFKHSVGLVTSAR